MPTLWWLLCLLAFAHAYKQSEKLQTVFEWKYIDYTWRNKMHRRAAIKSGDYDYTKCVMIDVDRWMDGRTFVTVIRNEGVPASLATVSKKSGRGGPLLTPYPDWSWANKTDCNSIISVYRVTIDHCDRLWVLDTGKIGEKKVCPPKLLVFDLYTDKLVEKIEIPDHVAVNPTTKEGLLVTPVVQAYGGRCTTTYVYMADVVGYGLVVYSSKSKEFWRLNSPIYQPNANHTKFTIAGESFDLPDGVLGMALSPRYDEDKRRLYFKPLAGLDIDSVPVVDLREDAETIRYHRTKNVLPSQGTAIAFSTTGTMFFGLTTETAIGCWNFFYPLRKRYVNIAAQDPERLQFPSSVKIVSRHITGYDEELWTCSNRLQKIYAGTQNFKQVNFRIMRAHVDAIVAGTPCESPYGRTYRNLVLPSPDEDLAPYDIDENDPEMSARNL